MAANRVYRGNLMLWILRVGVDYADTGLRAFLSMIRWHAASLKLAGSGPGRRLIMGLWLALRRRRSPHQVGWMKVSRSAVANQSGPHVVACRCSDDSELAIEFDHRAAPSSSPKVSWTYSSNRHAVGAPNVIEAVGAPVGAPVGTPVGAPVGTPVGAHGFGPRTGAGASAFSAIWRSAASVSIHTQACT